MNDRAMASTEPLLRASGLVKRYAGVVAIEQVSLTLARGEVLGIIGPNGAGKSTLIGLLGGALKSDEGRIEFDGLDVSAWPAAELARRGIGRTWQIPRPFLDMTVHENLLAARYSLHAFEPSAKAHAACDRILERTGLADAAQLSARELPLMRRKRLEVARALALSPKLLLLDEVGAGLVDAEVGELIELIQAIRTEVEGIIVVEHVLRVVRECCDRLLVINFGRSLAAGPTSEVLASDEVAVVYLGTAHDRKLPLPGKDRGPGLGLAALLAKPSRASEPAPPLLELCDIHAGYGQAIVLKGVNLRMRAGEVVAILGSNGAGKTTLAKVIGGAIQPTAGMLRIDGIDHSQSPAHQIARLGLAQCMEGRRIFATLSVEENLLIAARGVSAAERADRLSHVYSLFPDLKQRRASGGTLMSGGQQQMLAIGRALMSRPRLVLFDEISLGLAPVMMDRLYLALAELRAAGLTMLIVEQDVERALELADQVHVMEHGRIALSGTADDVRRNPSLKQLYIGGTD